MPLSPATARTILDVLSLADDAPPCELTITADPTPNPIRRLVGVEWDQLKSLRQHGVRLGEVLGAGYVYRIVSKDFGRTAQLCGTASAAAGEPKGIYRLDADDLAANETTLAADAGKLFIDVGALQTVAAQFRAGGQTPA